MGATPSRASCGQVSVRYKLRWGLLALALGLACQERLADLDQEERFVYCTAVNGAHVYDEEGNAGGLVVSSKGGHTFICLCITHDEGKDQALRDDINDEAYEICLANAAAMGYPEANDCADFYAKHHWGDYMFSHWPPDEDPQPCATQNAEGCGVESNSPAYDQP